MSPRVPVDRGKLVKEGVEKLKLKRLTKYKEVLKIFFQGWNRN